MERRAAIYLRSSKDRSDVSISAQRRELSILAKAKEIQIVREFVDSVESAKSEHRPAFQDLLRELKAPGRNWSVLLLVDTSRLSRRRYVAQVFKHEAKKRRVEILYSKVPETDPITTVILEAVFEAMDEVHSLMSREKGLAGMAENVRQGFRAGGRAPKGYQLARVDTGAVRGGEVVLKSALKPSDDAPLVSRYLKQRAAGTPRAQATKDLGIAWPVSTLIGMEWRALTYAGHMVWNQTNPQENGRYVGGTKYRPRDQWMVQKDAHKPLISEGEAELILDELLHSKVGQAVSRAKRGMSDYLLSGVLVAPDGRQWEGQTGDKYRLKTKAGMKGRYLPMRDINQAVVEKIISDLQSDQFINEALAAAHKAAGSEEDPAKALRHEVVALNEKISKTMDLAVGLDDPAPALRKVNELEAKRKQVSDEVARLEKEYQAQAAMKSLTRDAVKGIIDGLSEDMKEDDPHRLKRIIGTMVDRIVLDPVNLTFQIYYRISESDSLSMASPRGFARWAVVFRAKNAASTSVLRH